MQPPSSRTGARRTHHHRVATTPEGTACCRTNGLSGLDIARTLYYCRVSYVRAQIASSGFAPEILFKFRKAASGLCLTHLDAASLQPLARAPRSEAAREKFM